MVPGMAEVAVSGAPLFHTATLGQLPSAAEDEPEPALQAVGKFVFPSLT